MTSKWRWILMQATRTLWVRASLFALLGVASALVAVIVQRIIPWEMPTEIGAESVDKILNILATSMLAVTTFSLSIMVAAYSAATNNVTPRATKLLMQDSTTQNVLATFVGSFLFSLVGIIALSTGIYGERGRVVLFIVTIAVIALIIITILRWIEHLSRFGRMGETTDRVENAATRALLARISTPSLGARPLHDPEKMIPESAMPVYRKRIGYVQHIDINALNNIARKNEGSIYIAAIPGTFVHHTRPLAYIENIEGEELEDSVRSAFTIGDERSFDQDPRFGLAVMAEIGSRALSAAINDLGTAIDIVSRSLRLLTNLTRKDEPAEEEIIFEHVWVPPLLVDDMFDDIFIPLARDSANLVEIQIKLQKTLLALSELGDPALISAAKRHSRLALLRAEKGLQLEEEKQSVRMIARQIEDM